MFSLKIKFLFFLCFVVLAALTAFAQQQDKVVIYFDFNKSLITKTSADRLDSLIKTGSINQIEIDGHCDKIGTDSYNEKLSVKRAETVKNYLLKKGINNVVITDVEGYGKRRPVNSNGSDAERAMNRRVELSIEKLSPRKVDAAFEKVIPAEKTPEQTLTKQMTDTTAKIGSTIVLKNMNFQGGRHYLLDESMPVLEELLQVMKDNPKLIIEIQGHVCCTPDADGIDLDLGTANLSVQRAKTVYDYLLRNGISSSRLSYRGFGSSQKIYPQETTEYERTMNRRVEIRIVSR